MTTNGHLTTSQSALDPNAAPHTDYILLDASGSMLSKVWESCEAIDSYVASLRSAKLSTQITLATFSGGMGSGFDYAIDRDRQTPDTWLPCLESSPTMFGGGTPLYDAINTMARSIIDLKPGHVIIVTDGDENSSKTELPQAKSMLDVLRSKGWQISFLGCDWDNTRQARLLGADAGSCVGTSAARLQDATSELAKKRANYATYGTPMSWSEDERNRFGGYLGRR